VETFIFWHDILWFSFIEDIAKSSEFHRFKNNILLYIDLLNSQFSRLLQFIFPVISLYVLMKRYYLSFQDNILFD